MLRKIFVLTLLTVLLFGCAPAVTPQAAPTIVSTQPAQVQTEAPAATPTTSSVITLTDGFGSYCHIDLSRTTNRFDGAVEY